MENLSISVWHTKQETHKILLFSCIHTLVRAGRQLRNVLGGVLLEVKGGLMEESPGACAPTTKKGRRALPLEGVNSCTYK